MSAHRSAQTVLAAVLALALGVGPAWAGVAPASERERLYLLAGDRPHTAGALAPQVRDLSSRDCPGGWTSAGVAFDGIATRWRPSSPATLAVQCGLSDRLDAERTPAGDAALIFETAPQVRPAWLVGSVELQAYLAFGRDSALTVRVDDVDGEGQVQPIRRAAVNLIADRGVGSGPGLYVISLGAMDHSLPTGHRLRIEVSRSGAAEVKLLHARLYPSALVVRLAPVDGE